MTWLRPPLNVYFACRASDGLIKIGCSAWPKFRCKELRYICKSAVKRLAFAEGDFMVEKAIHRAFTDSRVEGEWFRETPELLALIEEVKRTNQIPERYTADRAEMARRYLAGATLREVGLAFGISHERVRQILRSDGVPTLGHRPQHRSAGANARWGTAA